MPEAGTTQSPIGRGGPVFLTGATGFIGPRLAADLIRGGDTVRALSRPGSNTRPLQELGVEVVVGNLQDTAVLERAMDGCLVVYHLATHRAGGTSRRADFERVNVDGTRAVLQAAASAGTEHFVFAGSTTVYGPVETVPATEDVVPRPLYYHSITKRRAEQLVERFAAQHGRSAVIARLPLVLGPGRHRQVRAFEMVVRKKRFFTLGSGETIQNIIDVTDAVDGLRRCAAPHATGCYVIAGWNTTINEYVGLIAEEAGVQVRMIRLPLFPVVAGAAVLRPLLHAFGREHRLVKAVDFFAHEKMLDGRKAREELGYTPQVPLRDTVRSTLESFRSNGKL